MLMESMFTNRKDYNDYLDFTIMQNTMANFYFNVDREVRKMFNKNKQAVEALLLEDKASW